MRSPVRYNRAPGSLPKGFGTKRSAVRIGLAQVAAREPAPPIYSSPTTPTSVGRILRSRMRTWVLAIGRLIDGAALPLRRHVPGGCDYSAFGWAIVIHQCKQQAGRGRLRSRSPPVSIVRSAWPAGSGSRSTASANGGWRGSCAETAYDRRHPFQQRFRRYYAFQRQGCGGWLRRPGRERSPTPMRQTRARRSASPGQSRLIW